MKNAAQIGFSIPNTFTIRLNKVSDEVDAVLHRMMRRQRSAVRVAYNQFREGKSSEEVYARVRALFPEMDSYEVSSIRVEGAQTLTSQKALLPTYRTYLQKQITKLEKKQKRNHDKNRADKLRRIIRKLEETTAHIEHDTVKPAVFGGRKLLKQVERGVKGAKEQWKFERSNQYFLSGDKSAETGNQHFGLNVVSDRQVILSVRLTGTKQWLELPAEYSHNQKNLAFLFSQTHYRKAVRLIRIAPGQYKAHITADEHVTGKEIFGKQPATGEFVCGIDLNLDHLTASLTDKDGQFRGFRVFKHPNLGELPKNKSEQKIFALAKQVVDWCKSKKVATIVLEDLNIARSSDQSTTMNRRTVSFEYRQLHDAIVRRGQREGLDFKQVNPAYTSWIGELKYQTQFGISRHIAAAYVIARRGLGMKEALPQEFLAVLPKMAEEYESKNAKARSEKKKVKYTDRVKTLREWKKNSPKTTKHVWKLWGVLLNYYKEHKSEARATHAGCGNANGRTYLASLPSSGGNTPPVLRFGTVEKPPDGDLFSFKVWTTQGLLTLTGDTPDPLAVDWVGIVPV